MARSHPLWHQPNERSQQRTEMCFLQSRQISLTGVLTSSKGASLPFDFLEARRSGIGFLELTAGNTQSADEL